MSTADSTPFAVPLQAEPAGSDADLFAAADKARSLSARIAAARQAAAGAPVAAVVPVARPVATPVARATVEALPVALPDDPHAAPDFRAFQDKKKQQTDAADPRKDGRKPSPRANAQDDVFQKVAIYAGIPVGLILMIMIGSWMFRSPPKAAKKEAPRVEVAPTPTYESSSPSRPRTGRQAGEPFSDSPWLTPAEAREQQERNRR